MELYHEQDAQSSQLEINKIEKHTIVKDNFSDTFNRPTIHYCTFCHRIWQCCFPLLLVFGLVGNALCLVAFAGPNLRPKTRALCCLLCALDSLSLVVAFITRCVALTSLYGIRVFCSL